VGGRWTGFFLAKAPANGSLGSPGLFTQSPQDARRCDVLRKGDLAAEAAEAEWNATLTERWQKMQDDQTLTPEIR
jgi:hypothetical protein